MNVFTRKLREVLSSVTPVVLIVLLLRIFLFPVSAGILLQFLAGSVLIVFGLTFFLIGVDLSVTPLGGILGKRIIRRNKVWIVVAAGLVLGFIISIAEPGLMILADQIGAITSGAISSWYLLIVVSIGIAILMVVGLLHVLLRIPLRIILTVSYAMVFVLACFTPPEFIAIAFDTSGATTGILAVPFILSLSLGFSAGNKDSKSSEKDSFGLVAITSVGAILSVMLINLLTPTSEYSGSLPVPDLDAGFLRFFASQIPVAVRDSFFAMLPLILVYGIVAMRDHSIKTREKRRFQFGFVYAYIGLVLFFIGVNGGFMRLGNLLGSYLVARYDHHVLVIVGLIVGITTILAEPAVYVLTKQIEDVTSGYIKRGAVLFALSSGVGIAVALSMLRIVVPQIQLWHYLLPGYLIALGLMSVVPVLFVAIAFDAGGVATGPMTATFILAFTHGAANEFPNASLLIDGFGMISMVALMPIISLQILGLIFKLKSKKVGVANE